MTISGDTVGVNIGGANLKYYSTSGMAVATNFAMWQQSEMLAKNLATDLRRFGTVGALAVTMTGELADCFVDRGIGVNHIVDHVITAASHLNISNVAFYGIDGCFYHSSEAKMIPDTIAAANWHALANLVAKQFPTAMTLVDVGSTTTDIIPLADQCVATKAATDHDRLVEGSLVYIGCRRTPVCAIVDQLQFRGAACQVMNEFFATIDDARLVLGMTNEDATDIDTADHHPRTIANAANRLARMIGLDQRSVSIDEGFGLALQVVRAAESRIHDAFRRVHRDGLVVLAGHGSDLLMLDSQNPVERLSQRWGEAISRVAPSYAVASLYQTLIQSREIQCGA